MILSTTPLAPANQFAYDFNGDGNISTASYTMEGPECLVFFLGGIPRNLGNGSFAVTGFSTNPRNPMQSSTVSVNRIPPRFEFKSNRLVDTLPVGTTQNGLAEYQDTLGRNLYAYFSAYEGSGYDPDDTNIPEQDDSGNVQNIHGAFFALNAATGVSPLNLPNVMASSAEPLLARYAGRG